MTEQLNIILPGMGANNQMYQGAWRQLENTIFSNWPSKLSKYSLNDLSDWVVDQYPDATCVMGSSLGGMVALLATTKLKLPKTFLFGSALEYSEVRPLIQYLQTFSGLIPFELLKVWAGSIPATLSSMYSEQDPNLIEQCIKDIPHFSWKDDNVVVHRAHGRFDAIIKCPQRADLLLNGGHLIALSHSSDCCAWLSHHGIR